MHRYIHISWEFIISLYFHVRRGRTSLGEKLMDEEMEDIVQETNMCGQGQVNYKQFARMSDYEYLPLIMGCYVTL